MIYRCGIFLLSWFICQCVYAQIDTAWHREVLFKTELTSLSPTFYPNLQLELEWPVIGNTSLVLAGGPMVPFNFPALVNGITKDERKGFFLNPSFKYYHRKSAGFAHYVSIEGDYRYCTFKAIDQFEDPQNPAVVYSDTIQVKNFGRGATLNYGITYGWKHFGFEFTAGLGLIHNQNSYTEEINPGASFADEKWLNIWQRKSFLMPRLPTRILIYYRF